MHRYLTSALILALILAPGCSDDDVADTPDTGVTTDIFTGDSSTDAPLSDKGKPDSLVPDLAVPDLLVPDLLMPDAPLPSCTDSRQNGDETDTDCGGASCPKCADGKKCTATTDCTSGVCSSGVCAKASCTDSVLNGDETDVDCGGLSCPKCAETKKCKAATDCASGVCSSGVCAKASCTDSVLNGDETDVDCGGLSCPKCAETKKCKAATDCASGVCTGGICAKATCTDTVQNGDETDVDCGGTVCSSCANTKKCKAATDCLSGVCSAGVCQSPSCTDGIKNGAETDTDCGGGACKACTATKACKAATDCLSGVCSGGACAKASCTDKVINGDETDTDCGGASCPACASGGKCKLAADCASGICTAGVCAKASCTDKVQNGDETDVDCGASCPVCADGKGCKLAADCSSGVCSISGKCQAPSCTDKVKNGDEVDVDCGGKSCSGCAVGKLCKVAKDCATGLLCQSGSCAYSGSCQELYAAGLTTDGEYSIKPTGASAAYKVRCNMKLSGGGWTLVASFINTDGKNNWTRPTGYSAWTSNNTFGALSTHDKADFKGQGFAGIKATDLMLTDGTGGWLSYTGVLPGKTMAATMAAVTKCQTTPLVPPGDPRIKSSSAIYQKSAMLALYAGDPNEKGECAFTKVHSDSTMLAIGGHGCGTIGAGQWGTNYNKGMDWHANLTDSTVCVACDQCKGWYGYKVATSKVHSNNAGTTTHDKSTRGYLWVRNTGSTKLGTTAATAGSSCLQIKNLGGATADGLYWIDPDGSGSTKAIQVRCDMTTNGGGWTMAFIKNSPHKGNYHKFCGDMTNLPALIEDPAKASASATAVAGWLDLNSFSYGVLRLASYGDGKLTFTSADILRNELRIKFGQNGYHLYGDKNGYYWCGGTAKYTDAGSGQVNRPSGAPADCKAHGSLGSGWDFSKSTGTNQGLTLCGYDASKWMYKGWKTTLVYYPAKGAAYAIWVR